MSLLQRLQNMNGNVQNFITLLYAYRYCDMVRMDLLLLLGNTFDRKRISSNRNSNPITLNPGLHLAYTHRRKAE